MTELLLLILSAQTELADCIDERGNNVCHSQTITLENNNPNLGIVSFQGYYAAPKPDELVLSEDGEAKRVMNVSPELPDKSYMVTFSDEYEVKCFVVPRVKK